MEQLANMPVWAQMLPMGSFMFASGVLMIRIPLAPAIILSFFYLYGAFNTTHHMPSFTLQHPWIITALYIGIPLVFVLFATWVNAQSSGPGDMQIGGTLWTLIALIPVVIAWLVSLVVAFIKLYQFIIALPAAKYVWALELLFFIIGVTAGVFEWNGFFHSSDHIAKTWPYFVSFTGLCILACVGLRIRDYAHKILGNSTNPCIISYN